jgi:hypothetical protein
MENIKHCGVIVRRPQDIWEGTRTILGLAVHNYYGYLFLLNVEVEITDELQENLDWLKEMECDCFSDIEANERYGFKHMPLEKLARELKKMDLIIPFGDRNNTFDGEKI